MSRTHSRRRLAAAALAVAATVAGLAGAAPITGERILAADKEPQNWLAHGRTYGEQRFSPLTQVNDRNVAQLGLAWAYATGTTRGLQATPRLTASQQAYRPQARGTCGS